MPDIEKVIAFARKNFFNDGAEGETVHLLCDEVERLREYCAREELNDYDAGEKKRIWQRERDEARRERDDAQENARRLKLAVDAARERLEFLDSMTAEKLRDMYTIDGCAGCAERQAKIDELEHSLNVATAPDHWEAEGDKERVHAQDRWSNALARSMARGVLEEFKELGAENYLAIELVAETGEQFEVTIQRIGGLTPSQKNLRLESTIADLRRENQRLRDACMCHRLQTARADAVAMVLVETNCNCASLGVGCPHSLQAVDSAGHGRPLYRISSGPILSTCCAAPLAAGELDDTCSACGRSGEGVADIYAREGEEE